MRDIIFDFGVIFLKGKYLFLCMLIAALLALLLCGCTKDNKADVSTADKKGNMEVDSIRPLTEIVDGRKNVYLIVKSRGNSYWDSIIQGSLDAGNDFDCNVYQGGVMDETNSKGQCELIREAIDQNADAIVLAPVNSIAVSDIVGEAYDKGIPVILIDTILDSDKFTICYMTENIQAGELAAEEMIKQLRDAGVAENAPVQVVIQAGSTTSQTIIDRVAGFMGYWASNASSKWEVIDDVKINNGDVELAEQYCTQVMSQYKDLKGIFACNNGSTVGSVRGITAAGKDDIVLVGFDYSDEMKEMIAQGKYKASTIVQRQYKMGYYGVKTAVYGNDTDMKFYDTGVTVINHQNVNTKEIQEALDEQ